jgi:hypothetical protein
MRTMMLPMLFPLCVPVSAQHSTVPNVEDDHRCEVYALAGYSSLWQPGSTGYYYSANPPGPNWDGGYFGVGVGRRFARWSSGVQAEFFEVRNSSPSWWPYLNTGAVNLTLEKRTGRVRPGGIALGLGGATDGQSTFLFVQFAAGVAVQLNDRFCVRPQFRVQTWGRNGDAHGHDTSGLSAGIAPGLPVLRSAALIGGATGICNICRS